MVNTRLSTLLVILAGALLPPPNLTGQTAPAQAGIAVESQPPPDVLAKLDKLQDDLKAAQAAGDLKTEAKAFNLIGELYFHVSNYQMALYDYNQAMILAHSVKDAKQEAVALNGMGDVYLSQKDNKKAPEMYEQALDMATVSHDDDGAATALSGLGWVSNSSGQNSDALDFYKRALRLAQSASDASLQARLFHRLGIVYYELGMKQKALDYYMKALPVFQRLQDRDREATMLNEIGLVYYSNSKKKLALRYYLKALLIFRQIGERNGEALSLKLIGRDYGSLGEKQEALNTFNKALAILREVGDRGNEAVTLKDIGDVYSSLGQQQMALDNYNQALTLATAVNDLLLQALIFHNMERNQKDAQPDLAIFYGKQAVNLIQQARVNIQGLGKEMRSSFLASRSSYYHDLADLLIDHGRLPEAQEIIDLMKEQQINEFTRDELKAEIRKASLSAVEQKLEDEYQEQTNSLIADYDAWSALDRRKDLTEDERATLKVLEQRVEAGSKQFENLLDHLDTVLKGIEKLKLDRARDDVPGLAALVANLDGHTVVLYTLVTADRYRVIVIVPNHLPVERSTRIKSGDLSRLIVHFVTLLGQKGSDQKELSEVSKKLYGILITPIEHDLKLANAHTLVWELDDVLHYIPFAALYDPVKKKFLMENYASVIITPTSFLMLNEVPDVKNSEMLAMGLSRKYEVNFPALPNVAVELSSILHVLDPAGTDGPSRGSEWLDDNFTAAHLKEQLKSGRYQLVHLASHFNAQPSGDSARSFLLTAGNEVGGSAFHLTLDTLKHEPGFTMNGVELLTLSACKTAVTERAADGHEIDGLAGVGHKLGAKAVMASLWEVNDASTAQFMADFYKRWVDGGGKVTKVEALRQAQLDMLLGRPEPGAGGDDRGFGTRERGQQTPAGYAHPFYWAPFVLMGNWR